MQIVTDHGMDLSKDQMEGLNVHFAPLRINFQGQTYISGVDIQPEEFYEMLSKTEGLPTTTQPSPGEFAELYRNLAKVDADILSIHVSSGLSGTINSARTGAEMVPEANVTIIDSKTLSVPFGWQVQAAGSAVRAGWDKARILAMLDNIREQSHGIFTLTDLKYLINGGRISHIKGLIASLLNIKPIIAVEKDSGKYATYGQEMTLRRALDKLIQVVGELVPETKKMRVQLLHGNNLPAVDLLREKISQVFDCHWETTVPVAPVLGAHTGPSLVGLAVAPMELFSGLL